MPCAFVHRLAEDVLNLDWLRETLTLKVVRICQCESLMRWTCCPLMCCHYLCRKRVTLPENLVKGTNLARFNNEATLFIVRFRLTDFDLNFVVGFIVKTVGISYNQNFAHILQHCSIKLLVEEFSKREVTLTSFVMRIDELFGSDALLDFYLRCQQGLP